MKKNLFLTCALVLASFVGVSAQNWSRTLTRIVGESITHTVNGTTITQHKSGTQEVVTLPQATNALRFTVVETAPQMEVKGGGPCWAVAEFYVLDANGDTIKYSNVTSNADHNTMGGAGNDGAGMPGLNDGNLNNFFHTTWSVQAPDAYHYIEFTLERSVDAVQLVWYGRPNNSKNNPSVAGLTPAGVEFTDDMLFAEYNYSQGDKATAEQVAAGGYFTFYVEGPAEYGDYEGPGDVYVSLSGYTTGDASIPSPSTIIQLIPTSAGDFIIYQPVAATYWGNSDRWTDGYNGVNGWQRANADASVLGKFMVEEAANGEFEISTYLTRQYVNEAWQQYDEPLQVWVGYDMRGNLKLFPASEKALLENGNYTSGSFGLPVDFTFRIDVANVDKTVLPELTAATLCEKVIASTLEVAAEKKSEYAEYVDGGYDWDDAAVLLEEAIEAANDAVSSEDVAAVFEAKDALNDAIAAYAMIKKNYYEELLGELETECNENMAEYPYSQEDTGKYTTASQSYLQTAKDALYELVELSETGLTYSQVETAYETVENCIASFENSKLYFSEFPAQYEDVNNVLANNHRSYTSNPVVLTKPVSGIRITFTKSNSTHMNQGYPQIVLAEFDLFDAEGEEVELTADSFASNSVENEGAIDNLCNGLIDSGSATVNTYEYWHSIWSGGAHNPEGHVYLDVTFPAPMDNFSFKFTGRNISGSHDQQFPVSFVLTEVGEKYDPLLFAENPYSVAVLEQVMPGESFSADELYVIKGLLNTHDEYGVDEETGEPIGVAKFYEGISRFHSSAAALRAGSVYRIIPNADGTHKLYSLKLAKYWPSTTDEGTYIVPTYSESKAADLTITAANGNDMFENTFVMYETRDGLQTVHEYDYDGDETVDETKTYDTPYVVYMDWHSGVASRPVIDPQPRGGVAADALDSWGDSLCFNKGNGEGQWEIYRVKMSNPDFYRLTNMTGAIDELGLIVGDDPGCVSNLGELESALAAGVECVADSDYVAAPSVAAELASKISAVENLEKNPMVPGVYRIVSANNAFYEQQQKTKSLYATVDESGVASFGWKDSPEGEDIQFYFDFQKSEDAESLVLDGILTEEEGELLYTIRAIATYVQGVPYYVGEATDRSTVFELQEEFGANYLVLNAAGSSMNLANPANKAQFCIHANGHGGGASASGNIVYWDGTAGASQWYLKKVDYETSIEDLVTEGDEVVSVSYYSAAGAALPAPAKGINIVVTVYANGVVETKKVLVK